MKLLINVCKTFPCIRGRKLLIFFWEKVLVYSENISEELLALLDFSMSRSCGWHDVRTFCLSDRVPSVQKRKFLTSRQHVLDGFGFNSSSNSSSRGSSGGSKSMLHPVLGPNRFSISNLWQQTSLVLVGPHRSYCWNFEKRSRIVQVIWSSEGTRHG